MFGCLYVCLFVCTLYKSTFLNRSEPNFAYGSPFVWKRPQGRYRPGILDLFDPLGPFSLGTAAESWAQDGCRSDRFPRYPYIRGSSRCSRDVTDIVLQLAAESSAAVLYPWFYREYPYVLADDRVTRHSVLSLILVDVRAASRILL
jgi:hypothetical protein